MKNHAKTKGIHMKTTSLIHGKTVAVASAVAVSAALAIGMVGCAPNPNSNSSGNEASSASSQTSTSSTQQEDADTASDNSTAKSETVVKIPPTQALEIALSKANLSISDVDVVKNDLDIDDGVTLYEIDLIDSNNMEYEIEVDANTGKILSYESEPLD